MKIKYKMIGLFILSIFISVIIFLLTTYGLLNKGYFSGITPEIMKQVSQEVVSSINEKQESSKQQIEEILKEANKTYKHMCFAIVLESNQVIDGGEDIGIESINELITCLSQNEQYESSIWVSTESIQFKGEQGYLVAAVDKNDFKTITYYFNGPKAKGVLGKIMLLGLIMTMIISSLVMYLFMRKIMWRIRLIDQAIDEFEIGNLKVRIENQKSDELGKLAHSFNGMATRIEEQIRLQEEYEEKRKQLISNISHDLRTPLASVVGYSELLLDEIGDYKEHHRYLEIIHRKALYMEKLLNQLLEFSRLENGNIKVQKEQGDIVECIREILIEYIPILEEQQIELVLELEEETIVIGFDQNKLERAIRNLIDNALKYGMEKKKLRIAVYKVQEKVVIEIQDFGEGMNEETLSHIFERFYRGNKGRGTKIGGIGLGLPISQEIIKQHGGQLEIMSNMNQGTKCSIMLPIN